MGEIRDSVLETVREAFYLDDLVKEEETKVVQIPLEKFEELLLHIRDLEKRLEILEFSPVLSTPPAYLHTPSPLKKEKVEELIRAAESIKKAHWLSDYEIKTSDAASPWDDVIKVMKGAS